jgi:hypothetical protein
MHVINFGYKISSSNIKWFDSDVMLESLEIAYKTLIENVDL